MDDDTALEDGPALLQALNAVSNSVETLSLEFEYYPYISGTFTTDSAEGDGLRLPFIEFLRNLNFIRLRTAEIPITLLLGLDADAIYSFNDSLNPHFNHNPNHNPYHIPKPDILRVLYLVWNFSEINSNTWASEKQLLEVVGRLLDDNWRSRMPCLKRGVVRILRLMEVDFWTGAQRGVRDRCARAGDKTRVVHDEFSPGLWTYGGLEREEI